MNIAIRSSRDDDIAEIAAIYRHHVLHGIASFEDIPPDEDEVARRRRDILALETALPGGRAVGTGGRILLRFTISCTVGLSVHPRRFDLRRRRGSRSRDWPSPALQPRRTLLRTRLSPDGCRDRRQRPVAVDPAARVARFYANRPFPAVGFKFGSWTDCVLMQRALGSGATTPPCETGGSNNGGQHG